MLCTEQGIGLRKAELAALLGFAAKYKPDKPSHLAVIQFVVHGERASAYSTDGHRAIEAAGESDGEHGAGEWLVTREPLDRIYKALTSEQVLRLNFSGASLNTLIIEDSAGIEVATHTLPRDMAPEQARFPSVRDVVRLPSHSAPCRATTLSTKFLADLQLLAKAADRVGVDVFPPDAPTGPSFFRCAGDPTTTWTAIISAMRSDAAEAEASKEEDGESEEDSQPSLFDADGKVAEALANLKEVLDEAGATISVTAAPGSDKKKRSKKK